MVSYLYLVERTDKVTWDEYDSFVVCAESEDEARRVYPSGRMFFEDDMSEQSKRYFKSGWTDKIETLEVICVGLASVSLENRQVICASYNAG